MGYDADYNVKQKSSEIERSRWPERAIAAEGYGEMDDSPRHGGPPVLASIARLGMHIDVLQKSIAECNEVVHHKLGSLLPRADSRPEMATLSAKENCDGKIGSSDLAEKLYELTRAVETATREVRNIRDIVLSVEV